MSRQAGACRIVHFQRSGSQYPHLSQCVDVTWNMTQQTTKPDVIEQCALSKN